MRPDDVLLIGADALRATGMSEADVAISLGSTVALARAHCRLPRRLVVLAVSGREFGFGIELTAEVAAAIGPTAQRAGEMGSRP